jgi:hypothetical protein
MEGIEQQREIAPEGLERYASTRNLTEKPVAYLNILLGVLEGPAFMLQQYQLICMKDL